MTAPGRLADRAVLRIAATAPDEDVRGFLQGLVTQDMARVRPDAPQYAALLSAQGKCLFDFLLWDADGAVLIDCEAAQAETLAKRLTLYRLRRRIDVAAAPELAVFWSPQGDAGSADPRLAALGRRWLAPADPAAPDISDDWRGHRLAQGVAEGSAELGDLLWLECNAVELNGVAFDKGCYVGQENTARMNWRQKVNRRVVVVPIDQADPARQRAAYPTLGWSVEHRRVEDLAGLALPDWQQAVIA